MLASLFVVGGASAIKNPALRAGKAQPLADLLKKAAPQTPIDATNLVRINGAVHVGAGLALATGRAPRTSAAVLALTMPPTTVTGHRFWEESDPAARTNQLMHFLKNMAITGGLLMSTLDPDPKKKFIVRRAKDKVVQASGSVQSALGH